MKDYSQSGEQKIILDYFEGFRGTFLDVGANDGVTLSNTWALVVSGWSGVAVEPSPTAFNRLADNYINSGTLIMSGESLCPVNAAITTADGPIDLYDSGTHLKKGDVALLSTTVPKEMDRWKNSGEVFTKTTVRGITFETLMKEMGQSRFDFISIDAEGMDWQILQQINLTEVGCRLLCVEVNNGADSHFTLYAMKHGMRLLHSNYENRIYCR